MTSPLECAPRPLDAANAAHVRRLVETYATERVARALGVSRHGLLAALAGLPVAARIRAQIRLALVDVATVERDITR